MRLEFSLFNTYDEVQSILGARIKRARLSIGRHTQKEQAAAAGIPYSTYRLIELQGKGSIEDLIKVFISMGKVNELNLLFPKEEESLIKNYKDEMKQTKPMRISSKKKKYS